MNDLTRESDRILSEGKSLVRDNREGGRHRRAPSIGQGSAEEVLALPDVKERVDFYLKQNEEFKNSLPNFSKVDGNVVVSDIRNLDEVPIANRFLVYTMYPQCNVNLWVSWGFKKQNVAVATGYSIFNKTCQIVGIKNSKKKNRKKKKIKG